MSISSDLSLISAMASRLALDVRDFSPSGKYVSVESLISFADLLRQVRQVEKGLSAATTLYPSWDGEDDCSADKGAVVPFSNLWNVTWDLIPYDFSFGANSDRLNDSLEKSGEL